MDGTLKPLWTRQVAPNGATKSSYSDTWGHFHGRLSSHIARQVKMVYRRLASVELSATGSRVKLMFLAALIGLVMLSGGCGGGGSGTTQLPTTLAPTDPAKVEVDADTGLEAAGDEFLCYLEDPTPEEIARVETTTGGKLVGRVPDIELLQFQLPDGTHLADVVQQVENLSQDPTVTAVSPNWLLKPDQFYPNDGDGFRYSPPSVSDWNIETPAGKNWGWEFIRMPLAWAYTAGNNSVKAAVVDFGFQADHEDLSASIEQVTVIGLITPYVSNSPHGTHVAGIVAASGNDGQGIAGVSYGCTLYCYHIAGFLGQAQESVVLAARDGCNVINLSLGPSWDHIPGGTFDEFLRALHEALWRPVLTYARSHGAVVVQSAGNGVDTNDDGYDDTPVDAKWNSPAGLEPEFDNYIVVAASTDNGDLAWFSNFGTYVTVAAPGTGIWSCIPVNSYGYKGGTSMAAPFVTGLAAVLFSLDSGITPAQAKTLIEEGAVARGNSLDGGNFYIIDAWESVKPFCSGDVPIIID